MRALITVTIAASVLCLLSACASEYLITTTTGTLIQTNGKPKLNAKTAMYEYRDLNGNDSSIKQSDVTQIVER
jgi:hypothetical protein